MGTLAVVSDRAANAARLADPNAGFGATPVRHFSIKHQTGGAGSYWM